MEFPRNFWWGAAASAPQTEGHSLKNGKAPTTWDKWFQIAPQKFNELQGPNDTSNVYEMYQEDIQLMQKLHLNSYRTSISWARLLPDGKTLNKEAVKFYREYFQKMIQSGVEPIINLFHFDMPWWLMKQGGWENRKAVEAFYFYARTAFEQFGDLITNWVTFNEPIVHIEMGYLKGYHYPAEHNLKKAVQVGYHTLMAHVLAVKAFREINIKNGRIGIILNVTPAYSRSKETGDVKAKELADLLLSRSFLDPAVLGEIPSRLKELLKKNLLTPTVQRQDELLIQANRVDFVGINYYQPLRVKASEHANIPAKDTSDFYEEYVWPNRKVNPYRGWEIYPEALYDIAIMMRDHYRNIDWYVSENGMGVADERRYVEKNGQINDQYRIDFIKEHLEQLNKGIQAGSNCIGYHLWTFVDCWSWLNGYRNRYGLVSVDLENNFKRKIKQSGYWYRDLIINNGFTLEGE